MGFLSEWRPFTHGIRGRPSIFDDLFGETLRDDAPEALRFVPCVDVVETADAYELEVEVPGMKPDEVSVTLSGDALVIQGEKRRDDQRQGDQWHVSERAYGGFQRSFTFPAAIDPDSIEATSDHGVLRVRVAKAREAQPRRIEIRVSPRKGEAKRRGDGGGST